MEDLLAAIVEQTPLHKRWLNTLALMENCGAKKIAKFEHPTYVTLDILEHAWQEKRHAFLLKAQIARLGAAGSADLPDFRRSSILGDCYSRHYLGRLDLEVSRALKDRGFRQGELKLGAYLLVTHAIEVRALELYSSYQRILRKKRLPVSVGVILKEERSHLGHMTLKMPAVFGDRCEELMQISAESEERIFQRWIGSVHAAVNASAEGSLAKASAVAVPDDQAGALEVVLKA